MLTPSDIGVASVCRDEVDRLKPCPFITHCSMETQQLHHRLGIRGAACCFYKLLSDKLGLRPVVRELPKVFGYDD